MFLKTQGMFGRDRASGHAVYNYTNQNDTFAKYDAFRERRLILVTLSESKWRSMKLELEAASCAPYVNCSPLLPPCAMSGNLQTSALIHAASQCQIYKQLIFKER